jgi:polyisoprenoid-binding protein YceI
VEFSIKNLFLFTVKGHLADLAGTIVLDEADIRRSSVEAVIKAASIDTRNQRRDIHLRSADFLEVERYPDIHFQSARVEPGRDRDTLRVTGSLAIKGKSREVVLDVTEVDRSSSPNGEEVAYYTALTELDRFDFGINYGRGLIGRKLKITISVQALRQD